MHGLKQIGKQRGVDFFSRGQSQLGPSTSQMMPRVALRKSAEDRHQLFNRLLLLVLHQRQQALRQSRQIPLGNGRLLGICVPPAMVDRTEHRVGVIDINKGAGAIVNRLARHRHVVGVHHTMNEADEHPAGNQAGLPLDHLLKEGQGRLLSLLQVRSMPGDCVVEQGSEQVGSSEGCGILKGANPNVAGGHPGENRTGQRPVAAHAFPGRCYRQTAGGGNAEGMHAFADDVLPQHRAEYGPAIATPGIPGSARAFELNVVPQACWRQLLTQQDRPPVTEVCEVAKLMARIRLGDRIGPGGQFVAHKDRRPRFPENAGIETKIGCHCVIEQRQPSVPHWQRFFPREKWLRQLTVAVVKPPAGGWHRLLGLLHDISLLS